MFGANLVVLEGVQGQVAALGVEEGERRQQLKHLHLHHHVGRVQRCRRTHGQEVREQRLGPGRRRVGPTWGANQLAEERSNYKNKTSSRTPSIRASEHSSSTIIKISTSYNQFFLLLFVFEPNSPVSVLNGLLTRSTPNASVAPSLNESHLKYFKTRL